MKKKFNATLEWISEKQGGRKSIPLKGTRYCPLIRLDDLNESEVWSIDFFCMEVNTKMEIIFSFVSDEAPIHVLKENAQYGLYEGKKKVAVITIQKTKNS